jgi:hypothetical protein
MSLYLLDALGRTRRFTLTLALAVIHLDDDLSDELDFQYGGEARE